MSLYNHEFVVSLYFNSDNLLVCENKTQKTYFKAFRKNLVPQKFWTIQYVIVIQKLVHGRYILSLQ